MNVDEYLARIGYTESREPNLSTLKQLTYCHKTSVAFSNLQFFGGKRTTLDLEKIYDKIVVKKQGGICYEINGLFVWLLRQLGFKAHLVQSKFYSGLLGLPGKVFTQSYYHACALIDFGDEIKYIADPGYFMYGPMKLEEMTPFVGTHAIYRLRSAPDEEDWILFERHKKTVMDVNGKILKQGPAPSGVINGMCNDECKKEESSHWSIIQKICVIPVELDDFTDCCNLHQDDEKGVLMANLFLVFDSKNNHHDISGTNYTIKESIDPVTDKILVTKEITSDDKIPAMARDIFGFEINHDIRFFNR